MLGINWEHKRNLNVFAVVLSDVKNCFLYFYFWNKYIYIYIYNSLFFSLFSLITFFWPIGILFAAVPQVATVRRSCSYNKFMAIMLQQTRKWSLAAGNWAKWNVGLKFIYFLLLFCELVTKHQLLCCKLCGGALWETWKDVTIASSQLHLLIFFGQMCFRLPIFTFYSYHIHSIEGCFWEYDRFYCTVWRFKHVPGLQNATLDIQTTILHSHVQDL